MRFLYDCDATLLPTIPFGDTAEGTRRIIPITGGMVMGPRIHGEVLDIGADWNLRRRDGVGARGAAQNAVLIRVFQGV